MKLHELNAPAGARKAVTRKGRGAGSGNGKTAGYGHKGQKARSGVKKAGFEGGQMPLQRRLPKRGFNNIFATKYVTIKVSDLEKFEAGATVDAQALLDAGIISKTLDGVKVLGNGELTNALQARGAATESLIVNISRQGLIYIPSMFILGAIFHETGLIWAQPVADVLSLLLAIGLYFRMSGKGND